MGLLTNPGFDPKKPSGVTQGSTDLFVNDKNGNKYRVVDGDTVERIFRDGSTQSYRIQGVSADERHRIKDGEYYQGEVGGDFDKRTLYEVLNNEGFELNDLGAQEGGQGAGRRNIASIVTGEGVDIGNRLFELGLSEETRYTSKEQIESRKLGDVQRAIFGEEDGYQDIRDDKPLLTGAFKSRALTEGQWYNPDYHIGVEFDRKGVNLKGQTTNPLSTAWDVGVDSAIGEYGGFLETLGHVSPFYQDWLQEKGKTIQGRSNAVISRAPTQRVGSWSQLHAESDSGWEYLTNGIEWIGLNTVQSAPYLAAVGVGVAGGIVAGALGAPVLLGGAIASIPLAAMHAGNVWNQIERHDYDEDGNIIVNDDGSLKSNKNATSASKSLVAGVGMAALDRLGLSGAIGVQNILTKEGRDLAVKLIKDDALKRTGKQITDKQARSIFNNAAKESTVELIEHMGRKTVEDRLLKKGITNLIAGAGGQLAKGASSEGLTEASQELTAYLVSAQVNDDIVTVDDLVEHIQDNWTGEGNIKELLIESAAAGTAVGGAIGGASTIFNATKNQKFINDYIRDANPNAVRDIENIFIQNEAEDGTISDQIGVVKHDKQTQGFTQGLFNDLAEAGKDKATWKKFLTKAKRTTAITPLEQQGDLFDENPVVDMTAEELAITPSGVLGLVSYIGRSAVNAPLFKMDNVKTVLNNSKSARSVFSRLTKARGSGSAGRTAEQQIDHIESNLNAFISPRHFKKSFGMFDNPKSREAMSIILREYGKQLHGIVKKGGIDAVTDADIANLNASLKGRVGRTIKREDLPALLDGAQRFEVYQKEAWDLRRDSLVGEYGIDSDVVKDFDKNFDNDWWWSHRDFDKTKVSRNKGKFIKFIEALRKDALKDPNLTDADKKVLKDPEYADKAYRSITQGKSIEDFSRVGGVAWGKDSKKRLLDVGKKDVVIDGETVSMNDFQLEDIFGTMEKNTRTTAQDSTLIQYFGDGGSDLDYLFSKVRQELADSGMSAAEVDAAIKELAKDTKNVIDSITGNFNRLTNKAWEGVQNTILQWTTLTGLLLSGLSSLPEFGTVALDVTGNAEAKQAINNTIHGMADGLKDFVNSVEESAAAGLKSEFSEGQKVRANRGFEESLPFVLDRVGGTPSRAGLYKRLGLDENVGGAGIMSWAHDKLFSINQLERITTMQRAINASMAVDFIRNRAMRLAAHTDGETYTGRLQDDYRQLRELGLDVPSLIEDVRSMSDGASEFSAILDQDDTSYYSDYNRFKINLEVGVKNFVDFRVQNPGAANRPLWTQDPHWRLFTQFQGFTSTVTTTIVPKLWHGQLGAAVRTKNPAMAYNTFALVVLMMSLGGLSQWVKDLLKYGESSPYLENDDLLYRALLSSGVLGQFEKAVQVINPLYSKPGETIPGRIIETSAGPFGRQVGNLADAAFYQSKGNTDAALRAFLKNVPLTSAFPSLRNKLTGREE